MSAPPSTPNLRDADWAIKTFRAAADALRTSSLRRGCVVHLPARGRLLATGDLHDNPIHLDLITRLARLDGSPDHHVIFHEMIHGERLVNGLDFSHRMLLRVAHLVVRFPGQVHPLLANHELSQMLGTGVSKGAGNSVHLFNDGVEFVFGDRAEEVMDTVHQFIRSFPLALRSDSGVFCAHSVPSPAAMAWFDAGIFQRELEAEDYAGPSGGAYLMTWGRGHTAQHLADLAAAWGVRLLVLGHEHVDTGCETRGGQCIKLNSDHEQAAVVSIDLASPPPAEEAVLGAVRLRALM